MEIHQFGHLSPPALQKKSNDILLLEIDSLPYNYRYFSSLVSVFFNQIRFNTWLIYLLSDLTGPGSPLEA